MMVTIEQIPKGICNYIYAVKILFKDGDDYDDVTLFTSHRLSDCTRYIDRHYEYILDISCRLTFKDGEVPF